MNNFLTHLNKIFETLKKFESNLNLKNQIRKPKMLNLGYYLIDSMPLLSRASRSKICKENEQIFSYKE